MDGSRRLCFGEKFLGGRNGSNKLWWCGRGGISPLKREPKTSTSQLEEMVGGFSLGWECSGRGGWYLVATPLKLGTKVFSPGVGQAGCLKDSAIDLEVRRRLEQDRRKGSSASGLLLALEEKPPH